MTGQLRSVDSSTYDSTRTPGRVALLVVIAMAVVQVVTWLKADRAEGVVPLLILIVGLATAALMISMFGAGLIHAAKAGDRWSTDDLAGYIVLGLFAVGLAVWSGLYGHASVLALLMGAFAGILWWIRKRRVRSQ